jgi:hypothetical protein
LNQRYENLWIGHAGSVPWPSRSPDITPFDYFLWGLMKELICKT